MTDEQQAIDVEAVLRGDKQCVSCKAWLPVHEYGMKTAGLVDFSRLCPDCICQPYWHNEGKGDRPGWRRNSDGILILPMVSRYAAGRERLTWTNNLKGERMK